MLVPLAGVLALMWLLGLLTAYASSPAIHTLVLAALGLLMIRLARGPRRARAFQRIPHRPRSRP